MTPIQTLTEYEVVKKIIVKNSLKRDFYHYLSDLIVIMHMITKTDMKMQKLNEVSQKQKGLTSIVSEEEPTNKSHKKPPCVHVSNNHTTFQLDRIRTYSKRK